ncbi:hypothetical protein GCM10012275_09100 [Longimycelium tulufanense]|uniref:Uncharacterized protein n=1 Tax=Longimycelium tulufanense TaxID=907463 RepID=A0A8J3CAS5_9PSEU|nr:hypothetical protein [Longimycelium tulufanense]GGM40339.1 hypothetical protein GCM10012275_09100 [Longimycelium tulufanense]
MPRLGFKALAAALLAVVTTLTFSGSATAQTEEATDGTRRVESGMVVVGFDRDVARANGYEVVTLPDGREASVPRDQADAVRTGRIPPLGRDEAYGTCGMSWIEFNGKGYNAEAWHRTGFVISNNFSPAISFKWLVEISDNGGTSYRSFRHLLGLERRWSSREETLHLTRGPAQAHVLKDRSYALLGSGVICSSAGPWTDTWIS